MGAYGFAAFVASVPARDDCHSAVYKSGRDFLRTAGDGWGAVLSACLYVAALAEVVRRARSLPALRDIERRFVDRAGFVSVRCRAVAAASNANLHLALVLHHFCRRLRCDLLAGGPSGPRTIRAGSQEPVGILGRMRRRWKLRLLAATTNEICQDVASLPFLWILPLALYLATFAITFAWEASYRSGIWASLASVAIPVACAVWVLGAKTPVWVRIFIDFAALAVCLMLVHGELARSRPKPAALTQFYIAIGAGGALGGLFVAVIAPLIFHSYIEFPILIALSGAMWLIGRCCDGEFGWRSMPPLARTSATGFAFAVLAPWILFDSRTGAVLAQTRNFYGTLRVTEWKDNGGHRRVLTHGAITHGSQFLDEPLRTTPTTYYGRNSGAGLTLESHRRAKGGPLRVGVIGLGAGTLAQYSLPGDVFRFYEINPEVIRLAKDHFTFLTDASAPSKSCLAMPGLKCSGNRLKPMIFCRLTHFRATASLSTC